MKFFKEQSGVIMMETLLTLPFYIVLLAGLFWLGEVSLARLTFVEAENFTLWANGNRHDSAPLALQRFFWSFDPDGDVTIKAGIKSDNFGTPDNSANGWGEINQGNLVGQTKRSNWSWGAADFHRVLYPEISSGETAGKDFEESAARGGNVKILSRSNGGARSGTGSYANSVGWNNIYLGSWQGIVSPASAGVAHAISAYTRNSNYVNWSN